jgi:hypothetical protein
LARRFLGALSPRPPSPDDEAWAGDQLLAAERHLWRQMPNQDRRHAIAVTRRFVDRRPSATREEIAGALLHDVGKLQAGLGTMSRVVATVVGGRTRRFRLYHDHERLGAEMLAAAGSPAETVELVRGAGPAFDDLAEADNL